MSAGPSAGALAGSSSPSSGNAGAIASAGRAAPAAGSGSVTGGSRAQEPAPEAGSASAGRDAGGSTLDPFQPPLVTDGPALPGTANEWTYTEFADTQCRDGSAAGVFVNLGTSKNLMIFMEAGGRCASPETCLVNPGTIDQGTVLRGITSAGILDRTKAENPVRDWNIVYVPYCTGDRHGGGNPSGNVAEVGPQKFVGYLNMQKFLNRIVPTFRDATDVLLTGVSAGGFGTAYNAVQVQRAFPDVKIKLVMDSSPFVSTKVFTECDQVQTTRFYKADQTFLAVCGDACPNPKDWWMDYGVFIARTFNDRPGGLIEATADSAERSFFGIGLNNCDGELEVIDPPISAEALRADLLEYRERIQPYQNFGTFYPDSDVHMLLGFEEFYTATAGNVKLVDWFKRIIKGEAPGHAGP